LNSSLSVSVIIPAYNSGKTILRALDSVLSQSTLPSEIIVVDDGSSDNTCSLVEENYPDVKLIKQPNAGAAAARNTGTRLSTGELIAFLDSDDFWHIRKLEYQISIFERFDDVGICSTKCVFLSEHANLIYQEKSQSLLEPCNYERISFPKIFHSPYFGTPSVMMRKSLFEKVNGFNQSLETAEDVDLWLRSCFQSHYLLIKNPLTYVVGQEVSLSSSAKKSTYESHIQVINRFVSENKLPLQFKLITFRRTKSDIYCDWGSNLLVNRNYVLAINKLLISLFVFPNFRASYLLFKAIFRIPPKQPRN
jgi:glycosyltransferase involved in cell wall biosynthesis